jgi:hypothetical protein
MIVQPLQLFLHIASAHAQPTRRDRFGAAQLSCELERPRKLGDRLAIEEEIVDGFAET